MPKILIVDDSQDIRLLLEIFFKKKDCLVVLAQDGQTGIVLAKEEKPDCVLLDMKLPDLNGREILRQIREFDKNVKIFYLSGLYTEELEKEALLDGATGFLSKGCGLDTIVKAVCDVLRT